MLEHWFTPINHKLSMTMEDEENGVIFKYTNFCNKRKFMLTSFAIQCLLQNKKVYITCLVTLHFNVYTTWQCFLFQFFFLT